MRPRWSTQRSKFSTKKPSKSCGLASWKCLEPTEFAFAAGSDQLTAKSRFQLERQALWLTANDKVSMRLRSESASPKGIEERRLALRRAEAVLSYLKEVGVEADRIVGIDIDYGKSNTVSTLIDKFHFGKPAARQTSRELRKSKS